jgi:hypothetical protein
MREDNLTTLLSSSATLLSSGPTFGMLALLMESLGLSIKHTGLLSSGATLLCSGSTYHQVSLAYEEPQS